MVRLHNKVGKTYVVALVDVEIRVHVSLMSTVHGSGHARPRLLEGKHTLDVVSVALLARYRIDDGGLNAKEGKRGATRLGGRNAGERGDDVGTSLGLPVCLRHMLVSFL